MRLATQDKASALALVKRVVPSLTNEPLAGMLWVVDENAVRIRGNLQ